MQAAFFQIFERGVLQFAVWVVPAAAHKIPLEVKTGGMPMVAAVLASSSAFFFMVSNEVEPTQPIVPTWWSINKRTESCELNGWYIFSSFGALFESVASIVSVWIWINGVKWITFIRI